MEKNNSFDLNYLMSIYRDLAESNREQARILQGLHSNVASINTAMQSLTKQSDENSKAIREHDLKIREVERQHDSCEARTNMKAVWYNIKRLNTFKDMISLRADEDTGVIDVRAARLKEQADADRKDMSGFKAMAIKFLPWFILVFVVGVSLTTVVFMKAFSGNDINVGEIRMPSVGVQNK
jgi:hypothetical protein